MNKDRQHIEHGIETCNSISYEHSRNTSIWRLSDIQRFPMRSILN